MNNEDKDEKPKIHDTRQVVGVQMGANCPPLVAYLFLFCYERELMSSPTYDKQADIIEDLNTTTRYLDDILNIIII